MFKTDSRIEKIGCTYGYDAQSRQCIEEMAELTKAINKYWRKQLQCGRVEVEKASIHNEEYENLIEEIADVQITLDQMKMLTDCEDRIFEIIDYKLNRQIERIENKLQT
jgi:NTP pyrophosphatase (non-canonical NTP hydrolase)